MSNEKMPKMPNLVSYMQNLYCILLTCGNIKSHFFHIYVLLIGYIWPSYIDFMWHIYLIEFYMRHVFFFGLPIGKKWKHIIKFSISLLHAGYKRDNMSHINVLSMLIRRIEATYKRHIISKVEM